ncbi:hypothetical protein [Streptomyces sp. NPDC021622]|uniref:hypothetical protein n=1 Tax=Streptomyces sp. NPDC021622 TaxID=3155013 RepID=UPI0033D67205
MEATSVVSTPEATQLGSSPRISAGLIAKGVVPKVQQALNLMQVAGAAYAAGVTQTDGNHEGLVHISLSTSDANEFAAWVRSRATGDELRAVEEAQEHPGS